MNSVLTGTIGALFFPLNPAGKFGVHLLRGVKFPINFQLAFSCFKLEHMSKYGPLTSFTNKYCEQVHGQGLEKSFNTG